MTYRAAIRQGRETRTAPVSDFDRILHEFKKDGKPLKASGDFQLAQRLNTLYGAKFNLQVALVRDAVVAWVNSGTIVRTSSSNGGFMYTPA